MSADALKDDGDRFFSRVNRQIKKSAVLRRDSCFFAFSLEFQSPIKAMAQDTFGAALIFFKIFAKKELLSTLTGFKLLTK